MHSEWGRDSEYIQTHWIVIMTLTMIDEFKINGCFLLYFKVQRVKAKWQSLQCTLFHYFASQNLPCFIILFNFFVLRYSQILLSMEEHSKSDAQNRMNKSGQFLMRSIVSFNMQYFCFSLSGQSSGFSFCFPPVHPLHIFSLLFLTNLPFSSIVWYSLQRKRIYIKMTTTKTTKTQMTHYKQIFYRKWQPGRRLVFARFHRKSFSGTKKTTNTAAAVAATAAAKQMLSKWLRSAAPRRLLMHSLLSLRQPASQWIGCHSRQRRHLFNR